MSGISTAKLIRMAAALGICGFGWHPAAAQNHGSVAQGSVSAEIIEPLSVHAMSDLDFGGVAVSQTQSGWVSVVSTTNAATYGGSARSVCLSGGCYSMPAVFSVAGEKNREYRITLPASVLARAAGGGGPDLLVSNLSSASSTRPGAAGRGALDSSGKDRLQIGGILQIPAATPPGNYSAEISLVLAYD